MIKPRPITLLSFVLWLVLASSIFANAIAQEIDDSLDVDEVVLDETCAVDVIDIPEQVVIDYDPFVPGVTVQQIKFMLNNASSSICEFVLQVSPPEEGPELEYDFPDTGVRFQVRPAQDQSVVTTTQVAGIYSLAVPSGSNSMVIFETVIIKDSVASAADHLAEIQFKLTPASESLGVAEQWVTDVVLRSLPRAQVNLSGTSGGFGEVGSMSVVDFGIAKEGAVRNLFIQLRSNTVSRLTIESENKGVLKHKEFPKEAPPITYSASIDGTNIDLTKKYEAEYDLPKTYAGESVPFQLKLGKIKGAMAGKHSDIIEFEFSPL